LDSFLGSNKNPQITADKDQAGFSIKNCPLDGFLVSNETQQNTTETVQAVFSSKNCPLDSFLLSANFLSTRMEIPESGGIEISVSPPLLVICFFFTRVSGDPSPRDSCSRASMSELSWAVVGK